MAFKAIQTSFSAGEISPALFARVDLAKYKAGAASLRNFFVDYKGGASNRGGTRFIGASKQAYTDNLHPPRLLPFTVSTLATYLVELGDKYARFISNGAYVTEAATTITGITNANPGVVTDAAAYSNGDWLELSVVGMPALNGATVIVSGASGSTFNLTDIFGNNIDTTLFGTFVSGTAARIYTLTSPYAIADLPLLKYVQSADTMTLDHPSYFPYDLTRTSSTTFAFTQESYGSTVTTPTGLTGNRGFNGSITSPAAGGAVQGYVVTAVSADGKEESVPTLPFFVNGLHILGGAIVNLKWTASTTPVAFYKVYKVGLFVDRGLNNISPSIPPTVYGYIGQALGTAFCDNNIAPDYSQTPPEFQDPFSPGQIAQVTVSGGGGSYSTVSVYIYSLVFTGGGGTGAAGYVVIDPVSNNPAAVVLTNPGKNYTTAPTCTDTGPNTATYVVTLGNLTGTFPATVTYFQQRRVHGGTTNFPESFVTSQVGKYLNFDTSAFTEASDAITASIAGLQANPIKAMVPMNSGMVVFTSNGGFLVSGGSPGAAITPSDITALPQAASGANDMPPIVVTSVNPSGFTTGGNILYVQARGFTVRDLQFSFYTQSFTGLDRSVLASHLFQNFTLREWAYAEEPNRMLHVVRNDGDMLSFTYVPEQEIYAWTPWDTQGQWESVASVPEGTENAVYYIVARYATGPAKWMYYIERYQSRRDCCPLDGWFVDCALSLGQTFPAGTLSVTGGSTPNSAVTLTTSVAGVLGSTPYVISAQENYDAASVATGFNNVFYTDQTIPGVGLDRVNRYIPYGVVDNGVSSPTNSTGHDWWSGQHKIANGASYDGTAYGNHAILTRPLDLPGTVVKNSCFSASNTVPAGTTVNQSITGFTLNSGGTLYGNGTYTMVPLIVSGTSQYVFMSCTVSGGVVGSITIQVSFKATVGDVLTVSNSHLGGTGSGFQLTVSSVDASFTAAGTERRVTEFNNTATRNGNYFVDPNSGNLWMHANAAGNGVPGRVCVVYLLRKSANFALEISPMFPFDNADRHMDLRGASNNYAYTLQYSNGGGPAGTTFVGSPLTIQSAESTIDYKLPYFWFTNPVDINPNTGVNPTPYLVADCFSTNNKYYQLASQKTGARTFTLYRFDEPSAATAPYNTGTTGGGFTTITPWTSSTGPNTNITGYTTNTSAGTRQRLWYLQASNVLVALTTAYPQDKTGGHQSDFFMDCTYISAPDTSPTFDYHSAFVTGFVDINFNPLAASGTNVAPTGAAYAIIDVQDVNRYLNTTGFKYLDANATVDYRVRWLAFTVLTCSAGNTIVPPTSVLTPANNNYFIVFVAFALASGSAPAPIKVVVGTTIPETGWDTQLPLNSDYGGGPTPNPVAQIAANSNSGQAISGDYYSDFVWDSATNTFVFGAQTPAMWNVSTTFQGREFLPDKFDPSPPFLFLSFGTSAVGSVVTANCARIKITGTTSPTVATGTLLDTPDALFTFPDDPNLAIPILTGQWSVNTPVGTIGGLTHLNGKTVTGLADGLVIPPTVVSGGSITLPGGQLATNVVVGLKYTSQLQTLYLDVPAPSGGTIQGDRKTIPATTLRLECTLGIKVGGSFSDLAPADLYNTPMTGPLPLFTGDYYATIVGGSETAGQVCVEQDLPLPVTVLGIMPKVLFGDTER